MGICRGAVLTFGAFLLRLRLCRSGFFYPRKYHIIAAGPLPGVELNQGVGFPVGNVDRLILYPLSYTEFLKVIGNGAVCAGSQGAVRPAG